MPFEKDVKCVVWDLDETIWDGILIESEGIHLKKGIIDIIQMLDSRGILQSIASKNNYDEVIQKLNEFGIAQYFLYPEIHWNSKSESIGRIQKNLNIGFDTMMFVDDQAFERDEVMAIHSNVEAIDAANYLSFADLPRLNPRFITEDSARRRQSYLDDIQRNREEIEFKGTPEAFLYSLQMELTITAASEEDLRRAEELTIRTNQLNSTGKTYDYAELKSILHSDKYLLLVCELNDKYGSYGKIGLAMIEFGEAFWTLKLLLMSCRVMSRGVGSLLLNHVMREAAHANKKLRADFVQTTKNKNMYAVYRFANFREVFNDGSGNIVLENDLSFIQKFPPYLKVNAESILVS